MKKILIIGGSGYIGRNIKEYLYKYNKYIVISPSSNVLDATNEISVREFLRKDFYDVVIHAAVDNSCTRLYKDNSKVIYNTLNMFYSFERNRNLFGKMIYFGSGAEYNKEYEIKNVTEEEFGLRIPRDDYGFAKYIISKQIEGCENIYNLRLFGVYGKYEHWKSKFISNSCCKAIKGIPLSIRQNVYFDYLWIDDLCKIVEWFINNTPNYNTYNVTSGRSIDLLTIATIINSYNTHKFPIYVCEDGLGKEYTGNNIRMLNELDFSKFTLIEEGILQLLDFYRKNIEQIDNYSLIYQ